MMKRSHTSSADMTADAIKQIVARYFTRKRWAVHFEVGLCKGGRYRADVIAMSMGAQLAIIEVKSSVADYRSDKKLLNYRKYGDQLYLAMVTEVYDKVKDSVPRGVGVFVINPRLRNPIIRVRAARQSVEPDIRLNVVTRMAYRSADKTKFERKSKTAGAAFVASVAVSAIQAMPRSTRVNNKPNVINEVTKAISNYV